MKVFALTLVWIRTYCLYKLLLTGNSYDAQASLHEQMRIANEQLVAKLELARTDTANGTSRSRVRPVSVPRRYATPTEGSLLDRIRAKAHAAAVKDLGAMLNRHKENVRAN